MSDNWIILVPRDPFLRVDELRLEKTKQWLRSLGDAHSEANIEVHEKPQFIDAGANSEFIFCPHCDATIEDSFWGDWMADDFDSEGFMMRSCPLPCCGNENTNLSQLKYHFVQAFGCCQVEGMNLNIGTLTEEQIVFAEQLMGTDLTIVYCHI